MNKQQSNIIHLETEREEGVKYMELLLAAETAILNYARKHGNLIKNPYLAKLFMKKRRMCVL